MPNGTIPGKIGLSSDQVTGLQRGLRRGLQTVYGRGLAVKVRSGKVPVRSGPG